MSNKHKGAAKFALTGPVDVQELTMGHNTITFAVASGAAIQIPGTAAMAATLGDDASKAVDALGCAAGGTGALGSMFPRPAKSRHKACFLSSSLGRENLDRLYSTTIHGLTLKTSSGRICTAFFQHTTYNTGRSC
jgi:hypothetical protein